jgi:hypothetical protein
MSPMNGIVTIAPSVQAARSHSAQIDSKASSSAATRKPA